MDDKGHFSTGSLFCCCWVLLLLGLDVRPRLGDVYLKILEKFVGLIPQVGFRVVYVPLVRIENIEFLTQFPVDYLTQSLVSSLTLFLPLFTAFAFEMSDHFVSIITQHTFTILLYLIYFCFNLV